MLGLAAPTVSAADVIHVSPAGDDAGTGSAADPVQTVNQAVRLAEAGDSIEIASGRYHESVQIYAKEVHLRAAPGASVVFDGATPIGAWTAHDGRWWAPWNTDFERSAPPFTTPDRPEAGWPEQFFVDDRNLREVGELGAVASGTFFHDRAADRVWIADDPVGRNVAGSALSWGIYLNRSDGSSIRGITIERYATQERNMAAVRAYADDLVLEDLTIRDNARIGVSVIGDRVRLDGIDSVDNGHLGVHAHRANDVAVANSRIARNNSEDFDPFHSAGGLKVTESSGLRVTNSTVIDNAGPGIWTDLDTDDVLVASNAVARNGRSGVEIELSSHVVVVDNTVHDNGEAGIWVLESSRVEVWHNSLLRNVRDVWIEDGPRGDIDDVSIVNNVLGGDAGNGSVRAILNVDDWTEQRSAAEMNIRLEANRYWLVPGATTTDVSRWARWPAPLAFSASIDAHEAATGQGDHSDVVVSASDPFSRSSVDARQPGDAPPGVAMPVQVSSAASWSVVGAPAGPLRVHLVEPEFDSGGGPNVEPPGGSNVVTEPPLEPNGDVGPTTEPGGDGVDAPAPAAVFVELGWVLDHRTVGASEGLGVGIGSATNVGARFSTL
ncbi:MAG: nitrous oxide reductase family maturation protein NosD [Ilumatobacter sp.]